MGLEYKVRVAERFCASQTVSHVLNLFLGVKGTASVRGHQHTLITLFPWQLTWLINVPAQLILFISFRH